MVCELKKAATTQLRKSGEAFTSEFLRACDSAVVLRSKEPAICWKAGGSIFFVKLTEYAGPNAINNLAPLILRMSLNIAPPPALAYQLKSPAVRSKLQLTGAPVIANSPALEVSCLYDEAGAVGKWLPLWLESLFVRASAPPASDVELLSWGWDDKGYPTQTALAEFGDKWHECTYLWSSAAIKEFEPWLMSY